ncbi:MAG: RNA polymerase sigma factor [Steroidobacteraceae bacterium]
MTSDQPQSASSEAHGVSADHAGAVKRLFDDHNRALVSFLRARLRNEAEARDVAQEAYVKLLQLDDINAIGFLRAYLFRIAANLAVDRIRSRAYHETDHPAEFFDALSDERGPDRVAIAAEELELVRQVLLDLPEKCRQAFVGHIFGGQKTHDIAVRLQLSERMIRIYIAQALALCRSRIELNEPKSGGKAQ